VKGSDPTSLFGLEYWIVMGMKQMWEGTFKRF
jgi:hypothetical protein